MKGSAVWIDGMAKQISKHTVKPHIYAEIGSQSRSANKAVDMCSRPQTIGGFNREMEFCPPAKWRTGPDVVIANHPLPTSSTVAHAVAERTFIASLFWKIFFWQKGFLTLENSSTSASLISAINKQAFAAALAVQSALVSCRLAHNNPSCASLFVAWRHGFLGRLLSLMKNVWFFFFGGGGGVIFLFSAPKAMQLLVGQIVFASSELTLHRKPPEF